MDSFELIPPSHLNSFAIRWNIKLHKSIIYVLLFLKYRILICNCSIKLHNYNIVIPKSIIIYISITSNISNNQTFRQILL